MHRQMAMCKRQTAGSPKMRARIQQAIIKQSHICSSASLQAPPTSHLFYSVGNAVPIELTTLVLIVWFDFPKARKSLQGVSGKSQELRARTHSYANAEVKACARSSLEQCFVQSPNCINQTVCIAHTQSTEYHEKLSQVGTCS